MIPKGLFIVCLTIIIVNARDVSTAYYWSSSADDVQFAARASLLSVIVSDGRHISNLTPGLLISMLSVIQSAAVVNFVRKVSVWCLIVGIHASGIAI